MSILLESLSQENQNRQQPLPDIHSSHFDDEMLGDEWLLQRLKWWRLTAASLLLFLLGSWGYMGYQLNWFSGNQAGLETRIAAERPIVEEKSQPISGTVYETSQAQKVVNNTQTEIHRAVTNQSLPVQQEKASPSSPTSPLSTSTSKNAGLVNNGIKKQIYTPQERLVASSVTTQPTITTDKKSATKTNSNVAKKTSGVAIYKDQLSAELRQIFPELQINSYVVSDTPKDSFVILDGGFYNINQVIAPDLILREITKKNIIVEFHSILVKIPLN